MEGGNNVGTLLHRRRKQIKISKEETLLILRAYLAHPTNWTDVLDEIKQNLEHLPEDARALYRTASLKQLRDRMSGKLSKITRLRLEEIEDLDIRGVATQIAAMERRLQPAQDNRADHQQDQPEGEQAGRADFRDRMADDLSSSSGENTTPEQEHRRRGRKRPLADIIRENQLLYNDFIKNKVPRLLRQLGVGTSSESE